MSAPDPDAERRRAIRRFVRDHHPDRGGDPDAFAEGLRRLRAGPEGARPRPAVEVHRRRGAGAVLDWTTRRWRRARRRRRPSGRVQ